MVVALWVTFGSAALSLAANVGVLALGGASRATGFQVAVATGVAAVAGFALRAHHRVAR